MAIAIIILFCIDNTVDQQESEQSDDLSTQPNATSLDPIQTVVLIIAILSVVIYNFAPVLWTHEIKDISPIYVIIFNIQIWNNLIC